MWDLVFGLLYTCPESGWGIYSEPFGVEAGPTVPLFTPKSGAKAVKPVASGTRGQRALSDVFLSNQLGQFTFQAKHLEISI
jgi:hypothetical protein